MHVAGNYYNHTDPHAYIQSTRKVNHQKRCFRINITKQSSAANRSNGRFSTHTRLLLLLLSIF